MTDHNFASEKNERYAGAFAVYRRLRRTIGWSLLGCLLGVLLVLFEILVEAFVGWNPDDRVRFQLMALAAIVVFPSLFAAFGAIFVLRFLWMCPRCGETFGLAGTFKRPPYLCRNCGLAMPEAALSALATESVRAPPLRSMLHWPFRLRLTFGRWSLATAFAAPFLAIAAAGALHAARIVHANGEAAHWTPVEGQLAAVEFLPGEDPQVECMYRVKGTEYRGRTFSPARCNTGDYWARHEVEKLQVSLGRPGGITVYHDPDDPAKSCLYRENTPAWIHFFGAGFGTIVAVVLFLSALLHIPKTKSRLRRAED